MQAEDEGYRHVAPEVGIPAEAPPDESYFHDNRYFPEVDDELAEAMEARLDIEFPNVTQIGKAKEAAIEPGVAAKAIMKPVHRIANREIEMLEPFLDLPEKIMGTVIGRTARIVSDKHEFPEASAFTVILAAAGCSVSTAYATAYSGGHVVNIGLYAVIEQPPATGKSRMLNIGMNPYMDGMKLHSKRIRAKNKEYEEGSMEGVPPIKPSFVATTEPTSAGMDSYMSKCVDGRFVIASAEQSAFITMFPQSGSFSSTNELLLKGWPGETVAGQRGGRVAFEGEAYGSVVLVAQPGSARRVLGETNGSGLAERFMYVSEPSLLGHRTLDGRSATPEELAPIRSACMRAVLQYSDMVVNRWDEGNYDRIEPGDLRCVRPSKSGYQIILECRRNQEASLGAMAHEGNSIGVGWLGKFEDHTLKVASIIHVTEHLAADKFVPELISDEIVIMAAEYVMVMADHLFGMLESAGESGAAAEVEVVLDVMSAQRGLSRSQILMKVKNRKPFRSRGNGAYKAAAARIDAMLDEGQLIVTANGKLEAV